MKETFGYYELTDAGKGNPAGELWIEVLNAAIAYIQQLERERDAAVADVKSLCATISFSGTYCEYCKYNEEDGQCHHPCKPYSSEWGWEWRGVKLDESQESE